MNSPTEKILEGAGLVILAREEILNQKQMLHSMIERLATGDLSELPEELKTAFGQFLEEDLKHIETRLGLMDLMAQLLESAEDNQRRIEALQRQIADLDRGDEWRAQ